MMAGGCLSRVSSSTAAIAGGVYALLRAGCSIVNGWEYVLY